MSATTKKHPALPTDEIGWYLYFYKGDESHRPCWRAGYQGSKYPQAHNMFGPKNEQGAIDWLKAKIAEVRQDQRSELVQRFLCMAWVNSANPV